MAKILDLNCRMTRHDLDTAIDNIAKGKYLTDKQVSMYMDNSLHITKEGDNPELLRDAEGYESWLLDKDPTDMNAHDCIHADMYIEDNGEWYAIYTEKSIKELMQDTCDFWNFGDADTIMAANPIEAAFDEHNANNGFGINGHTLKEYFDNLGPKYSIADATVEFEGHKLHRIIAERTFQAPSGEMIYKGNLGGLIENENNLDQKLNSWISYDSKVFGGSRVTNAAWIAPNVILDNVVVTGRTMIVGPDRTNNEPGVLRVADSYIQDDAYIQAHKDHKITGLKAMGRSIIQDSDISGMFHVEGMQGDGKTYGVTTAKHAFVNHSALNGAVYVGGEARVKNSTVTGAVIDDDRGWKAHVPSPFNVRTYYPIDNTGMKIQGKTLVDESWLKGCLDIDDHAIIIKSEIGNDYHSYLNGEHIGKGTSSQSPSIVNSKIHSQHINVEGDIEILDSNIKADDIAILPSGRTEIGNVEFSNKDGQESSFRVYSNDDHKVIVTESTFKSIEGNPGHDVKIEAKDNDIIVHGGDYTGNVTLDKTPEDMIKKDEPNKKYELLKDDWTMHDGHTLYRIRALKSFDVEASDEGKVKSLNGIHVEAGDLGGYIESEDNLSQDGTCWIGKNVLVYGEEAAIQNHAYAGGEGFVIIENSVMSGKTRAVTKNKINELRLIDSFLTDSAGVVSENLPVYITGLGACDNTIFADSQVRGKERETGNKHLGNKSCVARGYAQIEETTIDGGAFFDDDAIVRKSNIEHINNTGSGRPHFESNAYVENSDIRGAYIQVIGATHVKETSVEGDGIIISELAGVLNSDLKGNNIVITDHTVVESSQVQGNTYLGGDYKTENMTLHEGTRINDPNSTQSSENKVLKRVPTENIQKFSNGMAAITVPLEDGTKMYVAVESTDVTPTFNKTGLPVMGRYDVSLGDGLMPYSTRMKEAWKDDHCEWMSSGNVVARWEEARNKIPVKTVNAPSETQNQKQNDGADFEA